MARKVESGEWEEQLTKVLGRHMPIWNKGKRDMSLEKVAKASVAVNAALSAMSRGESVHARRLIFELLALGPAGWHRYLRDSRILQRIRPRLRMRRLGQPSSQNAAGAPAHHAR